MIIVEIRAGLEPIILATPIPYGGVTLASLESLAGVGTSDYNMTLDTADGFGNSYSYAKVNINSNFTTVIENSSYQNVCMDPLANQPVLAVTSEPGASFAPLTYQSRRLLCP